MCESFSCISCPEDKGLGGTLAGLKKKITKECRDFQSWRTDTLAQRDGQGTWNEEKTDKQGEYTFLFSWFNWSNILKHNCLHVFLVSPFNVDEKDLLCKRFRSGVSVRGKSFSFFGYAEVSASKKYERRWEGKGIGGNSFFFFSLRHPLLPICCSRSTFRPQNFTETLPMQATGETVMFSNCRVQWAPSGWEWGILP